MTELEDLLTDLGVDLDATGVKRTQYRSIDRDGNVTLEIHVQPLRNNIKLVIITVYSALGGGDFERIPEYVFSVDRSVAPVFQRTVVKERNDSISRDRTANEQNRTEIENNLETFAALQRLQITTITDVETRGTITAFGT